jgi:hypothetical protein
VNQRPFASFSRLIEKVECCLELLRLDEIRLVVAPFEPEVLELWTTRARIGREADGVG